MKSVRARLSSGLAVMLIAAVTVFLVPSHAPAFAATAPADAVFGQAGNFTSANSAPLDADHLSNPQGSAHDYVHHRLFVSDTANSRVLVFNLNANNTIPDETADFVLGQANFGSSGTALTRSGMNVPVGLACDDVHDRLYVADTGNVRILVFDTSAITNGMNASFVIGQSGFTANSTATTQSGISNADTVAIDGNHRYLFSSDKDNRRVMVWDTSALANGMNASYVIGQANFTATVWAITQSTTTFPTGVAVDASTNRLYVAENSANRVSVFDLSSLANGMNATYVIGQPDFTSNSSGTTQTTLSSPYSVAAGGGRVYVNDKSNHRVVVFDASNISNGQAAIALYGQPDYTSNASNNGGRTASSLAYPTGVSFDPGTYRLFVVDSGNNRLLIFNAITSTQTVSAIVDPSFTFTVANKASACNGESNFAGAAGSATAIALGHLAVSSNVSGGQTLTVSGNAGGGFAVYIRGSQSTQNLRSGTYNWTDVSGTYGSFAALGSGEKFGYTYNDSTASTSVSNPASATFAKLDNAPTNQIMGSASSISGSGCVSFDAQTGPATPAGSYAATVVYTALPVF